MKLRCLLALLLLACEPSVPRVDAGPFAGEDAGPSDMDAGDRDAGNGGFPDAGDGPDLRCAGQPAGPGTAASVRISGVTARVTGGPESNALVQLFDASDFTLSTPLDMETTVADGMYALDLDLPMMEARAVAIRVDPGGPGARRSYVFMPRGVNASIGGFDIPLYDDPAWNGLYMDAGVAASALRGTILVRVRDCAGDLLPGATVMLDRLQPDSSVIYAGGGTSTDGSGEAFVLNSPTGDVTLTVLANGGATELGQGTFNVRADRLTMALWR